MLRAEEEGSSLRSSYVATRGEQGPEATMHGEVRAADMAQAGWPRVRRRREQSVT